MSVSSVYVVLNWIGFILIVVFIFFFVVLRVIRRFIHFPIPAQSARLIDTPLRRRIQPPSQVIDWIGIKDGMYVLEIGPGPGTFTREAAARVGKGKVFAVDIQRGVIMTLKKRLQKDITHAVLCVASAYELPFSDSVFDRVFMVAVLAEIPDRKRALHEMKRVLKDDGLLGIGEFLPDPDYPRRKTVVSWCENAGFNLVSTHGSILHYVLTFKAKPK